MRFLRSIQILSAGVLAASLGCEAPEIEPREEGKIGGVARSSIQNNQRAWPANVNSMGLSLAASDITVVRFTVGFVGCKDPDIVVEGPSGIVNSSLSCTDLVFKNVTFKPSAAEEPLVLAANTGTATDAGGNVWTFVALEGTNSATLLANFSSTSDNAAVTISRATNAVSVGIDPGTGPICDANVPFGVTTDGTSKVSVSLKAPAGGAIPEGVVLTYGGPAANPPVTINGMQFDLDFAAFQPTSAQGNTLTYGPFKASKGNSFCQLNELVISVNVTGGAGGGGGTDGGTTGGDTPPADSAPPSVEGMLAAACSKVGAAYENCSRSEPAAYWGPHWAEKAQVFTVTPNRRGISTDAPDYFSLDWTITDQAGNVLTSKVIPLQQGVPTTIRFQQPTITDAELATDPTWYGSKDDLTRPHYLAAPVFYEHVAWRNIETPAAVYRFETINAVSVGRKSGALVELNFVPMVAGTFDGWCQFGGPSDYEALKLAGNQPMVYDGGGHPRLTGTFANAPIDTIRMALNFVVSADHDISLAAKNPLRNASFNGAPQSRDWSLVTISAPDGQTYTGQCFWGKCYAPDINAPNYLGYWGFGSEAGVNSFWRNEVTVGSSFEHDSPTSWSTAGANASVVGGPGSSKLNPDGFTMLRGWGHILRLDGGQDRSAVYSAPELFRASAFRKAMELGISGFGSGDLRTLLTDYLDSVEVKAQKATSLFLVPMVNGTYTVDEGQGAQGAGFPVIVKDEKDASMFEVINP